MKMHVNILVNGGVCLVLAPDNDMEEELLRALAKQENVIHEVRQSITIINKTLNKGIIIASKNTSLDHKTEQTSSKSSD